jgi:hypothetical protein
LNHSVAAASQRKHAVDIVVGLHRKAPLLERIAALHTSSCLADDLDGRQQEANERADDGNHDQQFYEREASAWDL